MDILFRNATLVFDGLELNADLGVRQGSIVAVGNLGKWASKEVIDCTGKVILPGAVDVGLNLLDGGPHDPESGAGFSLATRQAVLGGVTTVVSAVELAPEEDPREAITAQQEADSRKAFVDFGYHLLVPDWSERRAQQIRAAAGLGICSFWVARPRRGLGVSALGVALGVARSLAEEALVVLPPDDSGLWPVLSAGAENPTDHSPAAWDAHCPEAVEAATVQAAAALLAGTKARVLLAGISCEEGLKALASARASHAGILGACTLPHLWYSSEGGAPHLWPPARAKHHGAALWHALEEGALAAVVGGHKPRTAEEARSAAGSPPQAGTSTLAHFLPLLNSEGVAKWRLSLASLSQVACADPAKLAGLYPRKGTLQPGSDADFVLIDPQRTRTAESVPSLGIGSDFEDPLQEVPFTGLIEAVYLRGQAILGPSAQMERPSGRFLPRRLSLR